MPSSYRKSRQNESAEIQSERCSIEFTKIQRQQYKKQCVVAGYSREGSPIFNMHFGIKSVFKGEYFQKDHELLEEN